MRISFDAAHLQESDQSVRGGHTPYDLSDMQAKLQVRRGNAPGPERSDGTY